MGRDSPSIENLRMSFCAVTSRSQRQSDSTISLVHVRYQIHGQYRPPRRISVPYAGWNLSHVCMVEGGGPKRAHKVNLSIERAILNLKSQGMENTRVATRLGLSDMTVGRL